MSDSIDARDASSACGCCDGLDVRTPVAIDNPPGQSAVRYRVGTYADVRASLLARLSDARLPALHGLTTRADDDPTVALLDAWAAVADVLTFYTERHAHEAYLRTATERRSVVELAALVGYRPAPGVAATADLAFTVEAPTAPPAPGQGGLHANATGIATVEVGTQVQSVPAPGEPPQTFETVERVEARAAWNALRPRRTRRHPLAAPDGARLAALSFAGVATGLRPGDGVLVTPPSGGAYFGLVAAVAPVAAENRTDVRLDLIGSAAPPMGMEAMAAPSSGGTTLATAGGGLASAYAGLTVPSANLYAQAYVRRFDVGQLFRNAVATAPLAPGVTVFRTRAALFGHNAPRFGTLPFGMRERETVFTKDSAGAVVPTVVDGPYRGRGSTWAEATLAAYYGAAYPETATGARVYLDATHPGIAAGTAERPSVAVLRQGSAWRRYDVTAAEDRSVADLTLSARVTRLGLNTADGFGSFTLRGAAVFAASETLPLARTPIPDAVAGREVELDGLVEGLRPGQALLFCGESDTDRGVRRCERAVIAEVAHRFATDDDPCTVVTLTAALTERFVRAGLVVHGNVARATHGAGAAEVLGTGDARRPFPAFTLRGAPVTHVAAATAIGAASTLEIRVADVRWDEVPALHGQPPGARVYETTVDDDGKTTVRFGDGRTGARLPTGAGVRAAYRKGLGAAGNVRADALTLLLSAPPGLQAVTNPLPATGGADAETLDDARRAAPLPILALGRAVALKDYEGFALAFAGVNKALATWTWNGERRGVLLTVAGPGGAVVEPGGATHAALLAALRAAGDPFVPLALRPHAPALFRLAATLHADPAHLSDRVRTDAEAALRDAFAPAARAFGQPVTLGEVAAVLHTVPGVVAVDVDELYRTDVAPVRHPEPFLAAAAPRAGAAAATAPAAELLTLDPGPIALEVTP